MEGAWPGAIPWTGSGKMLRRLWEELGQRSRRTADGFGSGSPGQTQSPRKGRSKCLPMPESARMRIRGIRYTMSLGKLSMEARDPEADFPVSGAGVHHGSEYPERAGDELREDREVYRERRLYHCGGSGWTGSFPLGQAEIRRWVDLAGLRPQDLISSLIAC